MASPRARRSQAPTSTATWWTTSRLSSTGLDRRVPCSLAFEGMEELEEMRVPTLVVGSRDEADPGHPLAIAREYADRLPDAELVVEQEGKSPLAWQGAQLSRAIDEFVDRKAPQWA